MTVLFGQTKQRAEGRDERVHDKVDTIVGAGTVFIGDIDIKGTLRIDGRCEGKITSSGDVIVGENGHIVSAVQARNLQVAGTIKGTVKSSGLLEIMPTGKVYGDIEVGKVMIADGAIFEGQCRMHTNDVPAAPIQKRE